MGGTDAGQFVFAHLESAYERRAWALVDGDAAGKTVMEGLRKKFASWPVGHTY